MPEQLKPCPACQEPSAHGGIHENDSNGSVEHFIECWYCDMQGPHCYTEAAAIAAWNSLPRALTWTTEPPKVEHVGKWFWSKIPGQSMAVPVIVAELDGVLGIGRGTSEQGLTMQACREFGVKFAGPIQAPLEPEAS